MLVQIKCMQRRVKMGNGASLARSGSARFVMQINSL